ncbi:fumarate hydratase [candidate division WOR-1 bacterium RIFOXYA12_FULL_43_27]|uniref:Fumarate hydratase n=1 Tax=candidate division WOR-1 bacterium RIFOXYC2_FULL_46_14 TaxID=1802587 RepID=A0A1F4U505_UNCSA|nr:MAG: fumarate hydratase [candidate division WOR-1 bacterium RIFOXYA12_FULL_43_27]OGC20711.1 MAG: fumarate hydratase [candidate division WOR-1 bacterium RIFOXYB2_FULL_46_45]OGC31552.1 MAG: fumarate hydratase [candidate division WOR-1 bacterium RIFOXYA2_FULL_46_56]OGC39959.1 MAG: fumarate hydratase [candidate division WOR-1 bacterium RIFOXYC2_FULL_46_14]
MRKLAASTITGAIKKLCIEANQNLSLDMLAILKHAHSVEKKPAAKLVLDEIIRNAKVAADDHVPLCQDTGFLIVFIEIGEEVHIKGNLREAVNDGVRAGYKDFRKSIVDNPILRKNTRDNTPAILHIDFVPGDKIKIGILPKGGGAENCGFQKMFLPTASRDEIVAYIVEGIKEKAPLACPPIIIGVGMGGTFDYSTFLAKKALTRPLNRPNPDTGIAKMEDEILKKVNRLGIGAMGLGGDITALAVLIETFPCHIASLPVAVNLECHSHRYREVTI